MSLEEQMSAGMQAALGAQYQFVFPSAYGGFVGSKEPPKIHDMMRALRKEVGAIKAVKQAGGPMFPVRGAKDLAQKLADALNSLNMTAPVVAQDITICDVSNLPKNETRSGNPVFRTLAHVKATVRLTAPDTSFVDLVGSGHGGDVDDKSGGKASTYAWKDALLKGLSIPHEDMVDTDDDSSTGEGTTAGVGAKGVRGAAKGGRNAKSEGEGEAGRTAGGAGSMGAPNLESDVGSPQTADVSELGGIAAKIKGANSIADLELVSEAIKSGAVKLHGADKLKATQLWVARKEELSKRGK
jgi:hypothetical protein